MDYYKSAVARAFAYCVHHMCISDVLGMFEVEQQQTQEKTTTAREKDGEREGEGEMVVHI